MRESDWYGIDVCDKCERRLYDNDNDFSKSWLAK